MVNQIINETKSHVVFGTISALTVILFGGWSGAVFGWILGTVIGFTTAIKPNILTPKEGAKIGAIAGVALGIWLLAASLVQALLAPVLGQPAVGFFEGIIYGIAALIVTTISAALMAALQCLPKSQKQQATLINLAFVLIIFPFVDNLAATQWISTSIQIGIFVMLALGLNITVGFAGLLDLGYSAFFGIGAYTTALLSSPHLNLQWNFWIVLPIAAFVAAIAGLILGMPTLRLRGDYLAIVTLGFGQIVPIIFLNLTEVRIEEPISKIFAYLLQSPEIAICLVGCQEKFNFTNGSRGLNPISPPVLPIIGNFTSANYFPWYYLILILCVLAYLAIGRLRNSRLGRSWEAIREDQLAASAMGINLVKTKLLAFAMGATFAGFAGAFYAAYLSAIEPTKFDFSLSVIILCMVILGGLGNMKGVILGGIIIMSADLLYLPKLANVLKSFLNTSILPNITNIGLKDFISNSLDPIQMRLFLFGLTLVIMMIVRPEGLIPDAIHQAEMHTKDETPNE